MMTQPLLSQLTIIALLLLVLAIVVALARICRPLLTRPIAAGLLALRLFAVACLLVIVLNPFFVSQQPDPGSYRIAVLADSSASMLTRDLQGGMSRSEWLDQWLAGSAADASLTALQQAENGVDVYRFSTALQPYNPAANPPVIPGLTAIGDAMEALLTPDSVARNNQLGAIVLLSDGHHNSGIASTHAARRFANAAIPVSVIGIGETAAPGLIRLEFDRQRLTLQPGESAQLGLTLDNSTERPQRGTLEILRGHSRIDSRPIEIPANGSSVLQIPVTAGTAGIEAIRGRFVSTTPTTDAAHPQAFAMVESQRDNTFRVLYLGAGSSWDISFLRLLAQQNPALQLDALIRIDPQRLLELQTNDTTATPGRPAPPFRRQTLTAFPSDEGYFNHADAIILDLRLIGELDAETLHRLGRFVNSRGGGLLFVVPEGLADSLREIPPPLREISPVRSFRSMTSNSDTPLRLHPEPLFSEQTGGPLFTNPPANIPQGSRFALPVSLSRAARSSMGIGEEADSALLVSHAYGAGRAAWLGGDFFWRWQFGSERDSQRFREFWTGLITWLAVGGKDRMESSLDGSIVSTNTPLLVDTQVLGADYSPRMDARVEALIRGPDGGATTLRLQPLLEQPGRYHASLPLANPGAYSIQLQAVFPDGEELRSDIWFGAVADGPETRDTAFREQLLRDVARISGGRYLSYREASGLLPLPLSELIPQVQEQRFWSRSWPFLLLFLTALVIEWWLRRRHGLR